MTSEKKKNSAASDRHPFEGYLSHDEKILWMDGHLTAGTTAYNDIAPVIGLIVFITLLSLMSSFYLLAILLSCIFLAALLILFGSFWTAQKPHASPKGIYALTNKRLFHRIGDDVTQLALEDVPQIDLLPGADSEGTLTFARRFPALPDIENAAYVKTMIEQAQKERLKEDGDA